MTRRSAGLFGVSLLATALHASGAMAEPLVNLRPLGYLAVDSYGDTFSAGVAINDLGQVAGVSTDANGDTRAVLLDHGVVTNIGVLDDGYESIARDINNAGQVVGYSETATSGTRAFLYEAGVLTDLGVLPGGYSSEAVAINDAGEIIGHSATATSYNHAFRYHNGVMTDLGALPGGDASYPTAINQAGQVAGYADGATETHAFLYTGGAMVDLGTLGGTRSLGFGLNEAGVVVGSSHIAGNTEEHAFRYKDGVMEDLGTLGGSYAVGAVVNAAGDVGGISLIAGDTEYHAFHYSGGVMTDVGSPGSTSSWVVGINEDGDLLGYEVEAVPYQPHCWIFREGVKRDLGTLGGAGCFAADWNRFGVVTGSAKTLQFEDRAFFSSCPLEPRRECDLAAKGKGRIRNLDEDHKDKLKWKWVGGNAIAHGDLADASAAGGYRLCIYDSTGGQKRLVSALAVDAGSGWSDEDPKGWRYKNRLGDEDGVTRLQIKTGSEGRSKITLKAAGTSLPIPTPFGGDELFDSDPAVTLQFLSETGPQCWATELSTAARNSATDYRGKQP